MRKLTVEEMQSIGSGYLLGNVAVSRSGKTVPMTEERKELYLLQRREEV
jgi:hypothetical protein